MLVVVGERGRVEGSDREGDLGLVEEEAAADVEGDIEKYTC